MVILRTDVSSTVRRLPCLVLVFHEQYFTVYQLILLHATWSETGLNILSEAFFKEQSFNP